jgi:predicted nucleic-acid-binding protein
MLGLDTNVLIRFLVADDRAQFEQAQKLIRRQSSNGEPMLISLLVLLETEWVLRSRYSLDKSEVSAALAGLLESNELHIEDESSVEEALFLWNDSSAEFADCLIGARHRALGCHATATFDAKALRLTGVIAA